MPIPTVRIKHDRFESGFVRINEEDYDPEKHELYEGGGGDGSAEPEEPVEEGPQEESSEGEVTYDLTSNGFWTIYVGGEEVEDGRGKDDLAAELSDLTGSAVLPQELEVNG